MALQGIDKNPAKQAQSTGDARTPGAVLASTLTIARAANTNVFVEGRALDEALANVIRHSYHNCADGLIELECCESADGLEITLLDKGDAPDRSKICAREIGCDQPGGLGTHIIKNVMDTVSYEASPEGNRFVARKRLRKTP